MQRTETEGVAVVVTRGVGTVGCVRLVLREAPEGEIVVDVTSAPRYAEQLEAALLTVRAVAGPDAAGGPSPLPALRLLRSDPPGAA